MRLQVALLFLIGFSMNAHAKISETNSLDMLEYGRLKKEIRDLRGEVRILASIFEDYLKSEEAAQKREEDGLQKTANSINNALGIPENNNSTLETAYKAKKHYFKEKLRQMQLREQRKAIKRQNRLEEEAERSAQLAEEYAEETANLNNLDADVNQKSFPESSPKNDTVPSANSNPVASSSPTPLGKSPKDIDDELDEVEGIFENYLEAKNKAGSITGQEQQAASAKVKQLRSRRRAATQKP